VIEGVLDNDIIIKGICYGMLTAMVQAIPCAPAKCGVLGSANFVVPKALRRRGRGSEADKVALLLRSFRFLEPTSQEIKDASELELAAQRAGLNLDSGESLLCAVVRHRNIARLVTGDKRAIVVLEKILKDLDRLCWLAQKVMCLEQIFRALIVKTSPAYTRRAVCSNADVDRTLSICFACLNQLEEPDTWLTALDSYINNLRSSASTILGS
jgi:hypothetical protein